MPEGDTIYRAARALQRAIGEKIVTAFDTEVAMLARVHDEESLIGRRVERVESRGKWCLIFFSGDLILVTHMLMSGSWHIYRTGEKWRVSRNRMRVAITCGEYQAVAFNVPIAEFYTKRSLDRSSQIPKLGPDFLGHTFTIADAVDALRGHAVSHPESEFAVVLLNQRVVAGLGNVYKSEVAFAAGVNPFRQMQTITSSEMQRVADLAQMYMRANVTEAAGDGIVTYAGNRRTTHAMDHADRLWVYGRQGQECRRCGATIEMRKQGEQARSTYWCPSCQPWGQGPGQNAQSPQGQTVKPSRPRRRASC